MIEKIADVILRGLMLQAREGEGDRLVMERTDDLSCVELEGVFDVRALALGVMAALPSVKGDDPVISVACHEASDEMVQRVERFVTAMAEAWQTTAGDMAISVAMIGDVARLDVRFGKAG